jgi:RNA polymerase sigma-70 factor (ECF subfamily)
MRGPLQSIFRENFTWLRDRMRRHAGSHHGAEDVAAETFLQLAQHRDLEQVREPRALLTTIAKRVLFETWRRRDLEQAYLETLAHVPHPTYPSPEERALVIEALLAVDAALDALPEKVRRAFLHSQLDAMTYAEIGTQLGVSASMVRQYMARAFTAVALAVA